MPMRPAFFGVLSLLLFCGPGCAPTTESTLVLSNAGPEGPSFSENSCAPDDGWALLIRADSSGSACWVAPEHDWRIDFMVYPADFVSGAEISLGNTGATDGWGRLWQDGESTDVAAGTIRLEWTHDWADGVPYTGYYAVELTNGRVIEGTLEGSHCGGDPMCG